MQTLVSAHLVLTAVMAMPATYARASGCKPGTKVAFVDDAAKVKGFTKFRASLLKALAERDRKRVEASVSPTIQHSFGAEPQTKAEFFKSWGSDEPWQTLAAELGKGGGWTKTGEFCFPYLSVAFPPECDPFSDAVVDKDTPLFDTAKPKAKIIARLSREIVSIDQSTSTQEFYQVKARDGLTGYVAVKQARLAVGHRGCFARKGSSWELKYFLAGD